MTARDTAPVDLDVLERLAREATPGPWVFDEEQMDPAVWAGILGISGHFVVSEWGARPNDADFIAAVNPVVVLALVERVRAAEGAVERVRALASDWASTAVVDEWDAADRWGDAPQELLGVLGEKPPEASREAAGAPRTVEVDSGAAEDAEGAQIGSEGFTKATPLCEHRNHAPGTWDYSCCACSGIPNGCEHCKTDWDGNLLHPGGVVGRSGRREGQE